MEKKKKKKKMMMKTFNTIEINHEYQEYEMIMNFYDEYLLKRYKDTERMIEDDESEMKRYRAKEMRQRR
jgi:hypothetical protein